MKKDILIIANRTLHNAPRVIREIAALENDFSIAAVGKSAPANEHVRFIPFTEADRKMPVRMLQKIVRTAVSRPFAEAKFPADKYQLERLLKKIKPGVLILHEGQFLPAAVALKKRFGYKLVFNAHEFYPAEFESEPGWMKRWQPYYDMLYRRFLPKADLFINVCQTIADRCRLEYGLNSLVIPNAAAYREIGVQDNRNAKEIRMIYHGNCNRDRKIEKMIEVAAMLGQPYSLDLMITATDAGYLADLKIAALNAGNVRIIPPVKFEDIVAAINKYDIGLYILDSAGFNNMAALPNKFFEYIQAGLCCAVSPNTEMKHYTEQFNLGVVSNDFTPRSMANAIAGLSQEMIYQFKINARRAAQELSADHFNTLLLQAVKSLL